MAGSGGEIGRAGKSAGRYGAATRANGSRKRGPVSVGAFLPQVTRKAFQRFGFPAAALVTDWSAIVGPDLASYTRPDRIKWPRKPKGGDPAARDLLDDGSIKPPGATLVLRVDGPRALEIQHRASQLLERINVYFGYRAVTDLRILQAPVVVADCRARAMASAPPPRSVIGTGRAKMSSSTNAPGLEVALERLAAAVAERHRSV